MNSIMVRLSPDEIIIRGDVLHFNLGKITGTSVVEEMDGKMTVGQMKKFLYDEQPIEVYRPQN